MTHRPSLFAREDTLLGVCEGLGEETGVPPTLFRVAFALGLFWNPMAMVVAYLTLGAALALFRWAFPAGRIVAAATVALFPIGDNDDDAGDTAIAA